jgi:hypothetical protein
MNTGPNIPTLKTAHHVVNLWMQWVDKGKIWILWRPASDNLLVNVIIQVEVQFIGEPCDIQDKADCPPIAFSTPSQKRDVSLFHLTAMADSAAFCTETTANHDTLSTQSWFRLASAVLIVAHFFWSSWNYLPSCTGVSVWTVVLSLCLFALLSQLFPGSSDWLTIW